jgi:hypothetical protein
LPPAPRLGDVDNFDDDTRRCVVVNDDVEAEDCICNGCDKEEPGGGGGGLLMPVGAGGGGRLIASAIAVDISTQDPDGDAASPTKISLSTLGRLRMTNFPLTFPPAIPLTPEPFFSDTFATVAFGAGVGKVPEDVASCSNFDLRLFTAGTVSKGSISSYPL